MKRSTAFNIAIVWWILFDVLEELIKGISKGIGINPYWLVIPYLIAMVWSYMAITEKLDAQP